jgi:hypothetical protein
VSRFQLRKRPLAYLLPSVLGIVLIALPAVGHTAAATLILYASSPDVVTAENGSLFSIDLTTGVATKIGNFGFYITGLAYDSDNDILYGLSGGSGASINHLFHIDRTTGAATPIGPLGSTEFFGLAYDSTRHQLFATNQTGLYTVDSATGQATLIGSISPPTDATRELTFDLFTETLFLGTEGVINGVDVNGLNTIDRDTGALTFLGTYKADGPSDLFNNVRGIEFDPLQNRLLGIDGGTGGGRQQLLIIDPSSGAASLLIDLNAQNRGFLGLAFATHVVTTVEIDIFPDTSSNSINPKSNAPIPVAILTTGAFNASSVSPSTVRFGASGTEATSQRFSLEDANRDGRSDLLLQFRTRDTNIACGDTSASLTGQTFSGQEIEGTDAIQTVGCR